jgi:proline dehydrogenase
VLAWKDNNVKTWRMIKMEDDRLAQQVLDIAQNALNTGSTWNETDRTQMLIDALEDIKKLCQTQLRKDEEKL